MTRRTRPRLPGGLTVGTLPVVPNAGVKNADEKELQEIASEPDSTHVYNVAEFDLMHTVVESLTRTVCSRVEEQDREIKGTWTSAPPPPCPPTSAPGPLPPGVPRGAILTSPAALCASRLGHQSRQGDIWGVGVGLL